MSVFDDMVKYLDDTWIVKDQIVPCLIGPVGIGKTAAVLQHADNVKAGKVVTIIASQILPNEVSGITMPDSETKAMEIYDHFRLSRLQDGDILFFDELLEADQLVLSACLTLIESRQMMSGRTLPDIQIVAATNPTIKPTMLKENIRQRFVFRKFGIDHQGCRDYIKKNYGFDPGYDLVKQLKETGDEYNILTQRSLTKMSYWMSRAKDDDDAKNIAASINKIWGNTIGSMLYDAYTSAQNAPLNQVRGKLQDILIQRKPALTDEQLSKVFDTEEEFTESTLAEVVKVLMELPDWENIKFVLENTELEENESSAVDIEF